MVVPPRRRAIEIRGAATHNLKRIDVDIPLERITVVTGVSGSGKSSLAIDTLYAEGQRRFVESLSAYARQFLDRMVRPDFERIDFIPPAIAIGQGSRPTAARSTVGSMSQMSDLLQLLWAAAAEPSCPNGHGPIKKGAPTRAREALVERHAGKRATLIAPIRSDGRTLAGLIRDGYTRLLADDGSLTSLDGLGREGVEAIARRGAILRVVVDRLAIKDVPRLSEAIAAAFRLSGGRVEVELEGGERTAITESTACDRCGFAAPERQARLFSSASPLGACPTCEGFGRIASIDRDKVVPDPARSLLEDAIAPWSTPGHADWKQPYHRLAKKRGLRLTVPWQDLSAKEQALVIDGDPALDFEGVRGFFQYLERKRYKMSARILVARYRGWVRCETCQGQRLTEGALAYRIDGRSVADAHALSIASLLEWIATLSLAPGVEPLRERIARRLEILVGVGLGYLTLDREGRTLSAGEARRVHLSSALGAGVTGTLYVLDEPSIGLHPRDTARLLGLLRALAEAGNTVVIVEHDTEVIAAADLVIELGPGAGNAGGERVFSGSPSELLELDTPTAAALRRAEETIDLPASEELAGRKLLVRGASARNLSGFNVEIPLGALTCITGVSGSGKSTFLNEVLAKNLPRAINGARLDPSQVEAIEGVEGLRAVHLVDTSPLTRSVRSIPATYLDAWGPIRELLGTSPDAKRLGLAPSDFSFNSGGGRCEVCRGVGTVTVDMQFLADVTMTCEQCDGKRFRSKVLEARLRNKNIDQILKMSIEEARSFFAAHPRVVKRLDPLIAVGLGYLGLGQTTSTLSGGEAQRLKLAAHLAEKGRSADILLMDEPTTGLHMLDVKKLLLALGALIARGATIVVVEHHLDVIRHAHRVIDLGPEGGAGGGQLVVQGSIFDLIEAEDSRTGAALADYLRASPTRRGEGAKRAKAGKAWT